MQREDLGWDWKRRKGQERILRFLREAVVL